MPNAEPIAATTRNQGTKETPTPWGELALVCGVTVLALVPFLDKAFNVDDTLFLLAARQIQEHPTDFYGCRVNWYGTDQRLFEVSKNPPLASYLLAASASMFGWGEIALHLCFLLPALAATTGIYYLARRFCSRPVEASLLALATPAFLVPATSVMCDVLMMAFWCWAIELWYRGLDGRHWLNFAISSVCVAAAALSKYFALSLFPLLFLITAAQRRKNDWRVLWLVPAAILLGFYEWYTSRIYGSGLLGSAMQFAHGVQRSFPSWTEYFLNVLIYPGGCLVTVLCLAPLTWTRWEWLTVAAATTVVALTAMRIGKLGNLVIRSHEGLEWLPLAHVVVFAAAGISMLILSVADLYRRRDFTSLFLSSWLAGTWFFAVYLNWTLNGRSLLPLAPVLGILVVRQIDYRALQTTTSGVVTPRIMGSAAWTAAGLVAALALSMWVASGDQAQAAVQRDAADRIIIKRILNSPDRLFFTGHWGFQHYLEGQGAKAWDQHYDELRPADWIAISIPASATAADEQANRSLMARSDRLYTVKMTPDTLVTTASPYWIAHFYASAPLPFILSQPPEEQYLILSPRETIAPAKSRR